MIKSHYPIPLTGLQRAVMLLPICLFVSVVYRTIKSPDVSEVPKTALALWITIVLGMWAVAFSLWLIYLIFA